MSARITDPVIAAPQPSAAAATVITRQQGPDPRTRRDLFSRRFWRAAVRDVARTLALLTIDATMIGGSLWAALLLTGQSSRAWGAHAPSLAVLVLLGLGVAGSYRQGREMRRRCKRLAYGVAYGTGAAQLLLSMGSIRPMPVATHIACASVGIVLLWGGRRTFDWAVDWFYRAGVLRKIALVIAGQDEAWTILEHLGRCSDRSFQVVGHLAVNPANDPTALGGTEQMCEAIEANNVGHVVLSGTLPPDRFQTLLNECLSHGTTVSVIPSVLVDFPRRATLSTPFGWPLIKPEAPPLHLLQIALKRTLDVVMSAAALLFLAPVFALIALAVRLDTPGPAIFQQTRPGLGGRPFRMLKFRTMRVDAEEVLRANPPLYRQYIANDCKLPDNDDPRISRVGRFLRRTSLDELPQLLNVLCGHMSLVGPRPVVGPELDNYGVWLTTFLSVKPGMTGYWQVNGRSEVTYPKRADLDLHYIRKWSLALDLKILLLTGPFVVRRKGAH